MNRRSFLKATGVAVAGAAFGVPAGLLDGAPVVKPAGRLRTVRIPIIAQYHPIFYDPESHLYQFSSRPEFDTATVRVDDNGVMWESDSELYPVGNMVLEMRVFK